MSEILDAAIAKKDEYDTALSELPHDVIGKYASLFSEYTPGKAYKNMQVVRFKGDLYENMLPGNDRSPEERPTLWRKIDVEATDLDLLA